jgi:hypothetical protein
MRHFENEALAIYFSFRSNFMSVEEKVANLTLGKPGKEN